MDSSICSLSHPHSPDATSSSVRKPARERLQFSIGCESRGSPRGSTPPGSASALFCREKKEQFIAFLRFVVAVATIGAAVAAGISYWRLESVRMEWTVRNAAVDGAFANGKTGNDIDVLNAAMTLTRLNGAADGEAPILSLDGKSLMNDRFSAQIAADGPKGRDKILRVTVIEPLISSPFIGLSLGSISATATANLHVARPGG